MCNSPQKLMWIFFATFGFITLFGHGYSYLHRRNLTFAKLRRTLSGAKLERRKDPNTPRPTSKADLQLCQRFGSGFNVTLSTITATLVAELEAKVSSLAAQEDKIKLASYQHVYTDAFDRSDTNSSTHATVLRSADQESKLKLASNLHGHTDVFDKNKTEASMENRRKQVIDVCQAQKDKQQMIFQKHLLLSRRHHLLYCPVEKAASTFWRRFIYQLEYNSLQRSPFDVSVQQIYNNKSALSRFEITNADINSLDKNTKLLYVRDPYSRLVSAYVDKLLAPNPIYWELWGTEATGADKRKTKGCGENTSFPQFIALALNMVWKTDPHVMPINKLCTPCLLNYTVIGRLETFQNDVSYLLSLLNISKSQIQMNRMKGQAQLDAIEDSVNDPFSEEWMNMILKCVDKNDAAKRIWRKLQLRGVISWRAKYNIGPDTSRDMTGPDFIEILKKTLKDTKPEQSELKLQKRQALLEAVSSLSNSQLSEISRVFGNDFQMFGYEELSEESLKDVKTTGAFDWTKDWDLSSLL